MFWSTLFLAIPALALAAAVWGVLRRKWYGVLPLLVVAAVAWPWDESWWGTTVDFLEGCVNHSSVNDAIMLLLVCGAAIMSLAALWAGWSRGWWFWRAIALVAVPASLAPLEANELILICLVSMPVLAATAWLLRRLRDGRVRREEPESRPRQVSLATLFLAFVVLGLLATAVRSVFVGHLILADSDLLWLAASITATALAAAAPTMISGTGKKWAVAGASFLVVGLVSRPWFIWNIDPLGLGNYFRRSRFPLIKSAYLAESEIYFVMIVVLVCGLYAAAEHYGAKPAAGRIARGAFALLLLALLAPLVVIYPQMLPPRIAVTPLPPSEAHETIMRAALRTRNLQAENAKRRKFLPVLWELDSALPAPGHLSLDERALAAERLATHPAVDPKQSLSQELMLEIGRALHEKRDADALRLARLEWRVGQTFFVGGTLDDYDFGFISIYYSATQTVIVTAPTCTDQQCRELMQEARAIELAQPDFQSLKDYDDYWRNASVGWRDRLHDAAAWMTGTPQNRLQQSSKEGREKLQGRVQASLRVVQYVLALELYFREQGSFPQELSTIQTAFELPPLTDPYTDSAPIYRRTKDGYLLYSIGANGRDDGGKFLDPTEVIYFADQPDIKLVPDRATLTRQWLRYLQNTSPPPSATPKAVSGDAKEQAK
ncbi:MAG: hypothetical protein ACR2FY_03450 [Pirellulaceae bacterium]